ncbi:MAG: hypothetical protein ACRDSM_02315 [Pseudonocardiaceae bacterium]
MAGNWPPPGTRIRTLGGEQQPRRPGISGSLAIVHLLLTKRLVVDFCRLRSSLCRMR